MGTKHKDADISTQHKPRYRYNGKEDQLEAMNGMLDFGSRYYNPHIGRWLHPDPQAESYYQYSPYTYCANNPTNLIDPDGERIFATFYDGKSWVDYEFMFGDEEWQQGANIKNYITTSEIYALHVENIIRVEQGDALRTRYLSGTILKYGNKDAVIDKKTKTGLFFLTGDISCRDYKFLKGGEVYGYSYR
jgi:RHS repeat-associated protein